MASFLCKLFIVIILQIYIICNADTIIASDPYQYDQGEIHCNPSQNCSILCNGDHSCHYAQIYCPSNHSCTIQCTANNFEDYSCAFSEIYCPENGQCDVICDGRKDDGYGYSCYGANMYWPSIYPFNETYSLQCNGGNACQWITINPPTNTTAFNFECNGFNSCQYSDIYCPTNAVCTIICNGSYSCDHLEVYCPRDTESACNIKCAGNAACNFAVIEWPPNTSNAVSSITCDTGSYSAPCDNINALPPTASPTLNTISPSSNPTSIPSIHGMGCVNGNICIKVSSLSGPAPIWWWSIFDIPLNNSLQSGCSIADCNCIQIKQSLEIEWINGSYLPGVGCQFLNNPPFESLSSLSIDIRITTITNHVIEGNGIIKKPGDDQEWDFGSNFVSCSITEIPTINPTYLPTLNPTKIPTFNPTLNPTQTPTFNPTQIPTLTPSSNPSRNPTLSPTKIVSLNPTFIPSSIPTFNPSTIPTIKTTVVSIMKTSVFPTKTRIKSEDGVVGTTNNVYNISFIDDNNDESKSSMNGLGILYVVILIFITSIIILCIAAICIGFYARKRRKHIKNERIKEIAMAMMINSNTNNIIIRSSSSFAADLTNLNAVNNVLMDDIVKNINTENNNNNNNNNNNDIIIGRETPQTPGFYDNDINKQQQIADDTDDMNTDEMDEIDDDEMNTNYMNGLIAGENHENDEEIIDDQYVATLKGESFEMIIRNSMSEETKGAPIKRKTVKFAQNASNDKNKKKQSIEELLGFNDTPKQKPIESPKQNLNLDLEDDDDIEKLFDNDQYDKHKKKDTIGTVSEFNDGEYDDGDV